MRSLMGSSAPTIALILPKGAGLLGGAHPIEGNPAAQEGIGVTPVSPWFELPIRHPARRTLQVPAD
jgi:hypothetical protein